MIASAISFVLKNLPVLLFVLALICAHFVPSPRPAAERYLAWLLLLPIGVTGLWAGVFHVFFPAMAAADIGWQASPFQFEVGMADLAIGITAVISFWRSLDFKEAALWAASVFLLGDAAGHIHQMIAAGNFAPGNAGVPFFMDILCPVAGIALMVYARRAAAQP